MEDQLDPKLWEENEDTDQLPLDDDGRGADQMQDELAPKEDETNEAESQNDQDKGTDTVFLWYSGFQCKFCTI